MPNGRLKSKISLLVQKLHSGPSTIHIKSRKGARRMGQEPSNWNFSRSHFAPTPVSLRPPEHAQTDNSVKLQTSNFPKVPVKHLPIQETTVY